MPIAKPQTICTVRTPSILGDCLNLIRHERRRCLICLRETGSRFQRIGTVSGAFENSTAPNLACQLYIEYGDIGEISDLN